MMAIKEKQDVNVKISLSTIVWTIGIVLGVYFLFRIQQILLTLFLSVIIMSALHPGVRWMQHKLKLPRIVAILIIYISILFLIGTAITLIVPPLVKELPNFIQALSLPPLPNDLKELDMTLSGINSLVTRFGTSFSTIYGIVSSTFSSIFTFITMLVMAAYLLLERETLYLKISWFSRSPRHLRLAKELIDRVEVQLGGWVTGQLSLMLIIGVATYVGLILLSIPYALPLAFAAGFLEVLPNLGPTVAAVPAVIIAYLAFGPGMAVFVLLFYILVQQFENNLIVPKVMKDNADVNPLTTITLILIGLKLGSVVGALLSVPVYIVIRSVYSMWYQENWKREEHHSSRE